MTNVLRVPKLDLPSILAQQNPQIDLRLEAYENSTRNFLAAVSNYTQRAMTEITKRKDAFNAEKKKIAERTQHVQTETNQCKVREIELISGTLLVTARRHDHHVLTMTSAWFCSTVLEKEQAEKKEAEAGVAAFRKQLASIKEQCASLDVEIEQHRMVIGNLMRGTPYTS